jgi:hypothetical protein
MIRPDKSLNFALARAIENEELIKWLNDSLNDQLRTNVMLSGEELMRGQGKAQLLMEIIEFIEAAPEVLKQREQRDSGIAPIKRTAL